MGVVLLAALDDTGALPLLLALLGGDADQDDDNDCDDDANDGCDKPGGGVLFHFTCSAVNFITVQVVASCS